MNVLPRSDPTMTEARQRAETIVRNVRRDATEGLVIPFGWDFRLVSTGGARQFDTNAIIERYDTRIAMTVMADFILLGHQQVGSFALSSDKTELFSMAIGTYLDIICETFNNQAIPRLIGLNADHFNGITNYPKLTHGDVETPNLKDLSAYIKELTGCGVIMPDEDLEAYVRQIANLPERLEDTQFDRDARRQQQQNARDRHDDETRRSARDSGQDIDTDDISQEEDAKSAEAAKKRLGRT